MEVTTDKITNSKAKELYNKLIQKDIDALERENSDQNIKRKILDIFSNVGSTFSVPYLHYNDVPKENMFERSIAERTKLRRRRFDEIKRKERNINNMLTKAYFTDYQSLRNMYKKLRETKYAVNQGLSEKY